MIDRLEGTGRRPEIGAAALGDVQGAIDGVVNRPASPSAGAIEALYNQVSPYFFEAAA